MDAGGGRRVALLPARAWAEPLPQRRRRQLSVVVVPFDYTINLPLVKQVDGNLLLLQRFSARCPRRSVGLP